MLCKRIIPCLDIKNGKTVKGIGFQNLIDLGDPIEMAARYSQQGADELVILDITATLEQRENFYSMVEKIASTINIPLAVGGGINSVEQAKRILRSGADKITINSAAVQNPELINRMSKEFGNQCVVVAIDAFFCNQSWQVKVKSATKSTRLQLFQWALEVQQRGAGEILFTSIDQDGSNSGFAIEPLQKLASLLSIPLIASGGAGNAQHFIDLFESVAVSGALAAGIFHRNEVSIKELKQDLLKNNIMVRPFN
jgi:cyclase